MLIFQKDKDDIFVIKSENNTIHFLSDEEKKIILDILPQLCNSHTISICVEDLPVGTRAIVHEEVFQ